MLLSFRSDTMQQVSRAFRLPRCFSEHGIQYARIADPDATQTLIVLEIERRKYPCGLQ